MTSQRAKKAIDAIALPAFAAPLPDPMLPASIRFDRSAAMIGPQEAPPQANDDSFTTSDAAVVNGNLLTNDTPGDLPLEITAVNGSALAVGREFILASGARLRVNADGTFTYNPNGVFNGVPTTNDLFSYTVAGGDTATVTITIEDPLPPNTGTDNPETLTGTPGDDVMDARGGDDIVNGLAGNDFIDGGTGADSMVGSTGNDTYKVDNAGDTITELDGEGYDIVLATASYTITAGLYVEELVGVGPGVTLTGDGRDNILRGQSSNQLHGLGGNDLLDGGGGVTMYGGTGDDTYIVKDSDTIVEADGEGYDIAYYESSYTMVTQAYLELLAPLPTMTFTTGVQLRGNSRDNVIHGTAFADAFDGMGGNDTLVGGAGDDIYHFRPGNVIVEEANGGIDTLLLSVSHTLTDDSHIEHMTNNSSAGLSLGGNSLNNVIMSGAGNDLMVGGAGNDFLSGAGGNDSLYGDAGDDNLNGGGGADIMEGGTGADFYRVDNVNDVVIEHTAEAGHNPFYGDRISASINYTLAADMSIEGLSAGNPGLTLIGNDLAQIMGAGGNSTLIGLGGDDHFYDSGSPFVSDTMDGGQGNDTYHIEGPDVVIERIGEGYDVVYVDGSYGLSGGAEVEVLILELTTSPNSDSLSGNEFAQHIYANAGFNSIGGGGGADVLVGMGGDDLYYIDDDRVTVVEQANEGRDIIYTSVSFGLNAGAHVEIVSAGSLSGTDPLQLSGNELNQEIYGNAGANVLRGGGGSDLLLGGLGDDEYYIISGGETIFEYGNQGRDIIYTDLSHNLAAGSHVEIVSAISLSSTDNINLGGNALDNHLYGNAGSNILYGGGGLDTLVGGLGGDTYYILGGSEVLYEGGGGGRDIAYTNVSYALTAGAEIEILSTFSIGGLGAFTLIGNEFAQEIDGNGDTNFIDGKGGSDLLVGYGGADTFAFTTALGAGNVDWLADFTSNFDRFALDDAVFTGLALGALPAGAFATGGAATEADDRIVYNSATGQIFFDADGSGAGAAVQFASVASGTIIVASDFTVI